MIAGFRDLRVWQAAIDLVAQVYADTATFPREEVFGLAGQMRRAAVSIPSNIAEGHTREHTREYLHHVSIAQGSLAELQTQVVIASRLGYLSADADALLSENMASLARQLYALRNALMRTISAPNPQPPTPNPQ